MGNSRCPDVTIVKIVLCGLPTKIADALFQKKGFTNITNFVIVDIVVIY